MRDNDQFKNNKYFYCFMEMFDFMLTTTVQQMNIRIDIIILRFISVGQRMYRQFR